jgi:hypothetical protein
MGQALALRGLGEAQRLADQPDEARESLKAALALFDRLDATTEVEDVRTALAALTQSGDRPRSRLACQHHRNLSAGPGGLAN